MIAKGKLRGDGAKLARYLMTGDKGEIAQLVETRGLEAFGSARALVIDTLFEIGRSADDAAALWTAATTDAGPHGDRARRVIELATDIRITVEAG